MLLDATTKKIQIKSDAAATTTEPSFVADYADVTSSGSAPTGFISGSNDGLTSGTTPVDAVAAPGSGVQRRVREMAIFNNDTVSHTITVSYDNNGTLRTVQKFSLLAGQSITYIDGLGWSTNVLSKPLIAGGTSGQVLAKASATDYDIMWTTIASTLGNVAQATHPFPQFWGTHTTLSVATNGCVAMPVALVGGMLVDSITFRAGTNGSAASTLEWSLYYDTGTSSATRVASGTASWTASGNLTVRGNATSAPVAVSPGHYWLVIRNTGAASILLGIASNSNSSDAQIYGGMTKTIGTALGATIDLSTGWTLLADFPQNFLCGRVAGSASPWA